MCVCVCVCVSDLSVHCVCLVYVFNHRAILAEWFKGTQTLRMMLWSFGKTDPWRSVSMQCKLTSHLAGCRSAGVELIPIVAETLGGLAEDGRTPSTSSGRLGRPLPRGLAHKTPTSDHLHQTSAVA